MTKEALKLALEALEHEANMGNDDAYKLEREAIKVALAQPEHIGFIDSKLNPIQRTWVGLTDGEYAKLAEEFGPFPINQIEAKLKEKNELR